MMRSLILICLLAAALLAWVGWPSSEAVILPAQLAALRTGDVLLLHGTGWRSRVVQLLQLQPTDYSHVGLVVKEGDTVYLLHATPGPLDQGEGRVVRELVNEVLVDPEVDGWLALRPSPQSQWNPQALQAYLSYHHRVATPFDHRFEAQDSSSLYCSELVINSFEKAGLSLLDSSVWGRAMILYPRDFLQSQWLVPVPDLPEPSINL